MIIEYYIKNVYGRELMYIANRETRGVVAQLTGKETIDTHTMRQLEFINPRIEWKEVLQPK